MFIHPFARHCSIAWFCLLLSQSRFSNCNISKHSKPPKSCACVRVSVRVRVRVCARARARVCVCVCVCVCEQIWRRFVFVIGYIGLLNTQLVCTFPRALLHTQT
jgi:hypothetical protein